MALSEEDRTFLKAAYRRLSDDPLEPDHPFYQPIYADYGPEDPVSRLENNIEFSEVQSIQLFSGFRGSGKTTELFRLRKQLRDRGYHVLYANALEYMNPGEPVEISDMLIVLAGAFSDAIEAMSGVDFKAETFWDRLTNFLTSTELQVSQAGLSAEATTPFRNVAGGLKAGINLKAEIKTASSFRQDLQRTLANRLGDLKAKVDKFFEDGFQALCNAYGADTRVVFIFDQMEQIRGTFENERQVIASMDRVFKSQVDMLRIPYLHMVYTVPPWLKFVGGSAVPMIALSTLHLWNNDAERSRHQPCWTMFRKLVSRRLGAAEQDRLFGPDGDDGRHEAIDAVIAVCGGHIRDLLRLLRDIIARAPSLPALPVTQSLVDGAINAVRREFLPLAVEDANWLAKIAKTRRPLHSAAPDVVNRLGRFCDHHYVLYFTNGDEWYDVHPLIRDEIDKVLAANAADSG